MDTERLANLLENERIRFGVPGLGLAVVDDGAVALTRAFGQRDIQSDLPATERTLFAIASCSKAFTATLIAALVSDGLLSWDKPVRDYLPTFRLHDPVATNLVTARDLLSHRTGLPRHDLSWYANPKIERRELIEERLQHLPLSKTIREAFQYNNLMYATAGYLAGKRLDSTWEDALRTRLLEPLGMTSTCFSPAEASATDDWTRGYRDRNGNPEELPRKDFPACGPAGSIYSCVADMAQWLLVNTNDGRLGDTEVIGAEVLEETRKPVTPVGEDTPWSEIIGVGYALGWSVEVYRGHRILQHSGGIDGFSSRVVILPEKRAAAAILTNMGGTGLQTVAMYSFLDEALGLEPLPWGDRIHVRERSEREGVEQAQQRRTESATSSSPPAHSKAAYTGSYRHPGYGSITVNLDAETLQFGELGFTLTHRHFETWDATLGAQDLTRPVTFLTDEDGMVTAFQTSLEPTVAPIVFQREPDLSLATPDALAAYTGDYLLGSIPVRLGLRDGGLHAVVDGVPWLRLTPHRADLFTVVGDSTTRVRFVRSGDSVTEAIVEPGVGVLRRKDPDPA